MNDQEPVVFRAADAIRVALSEFITDVALLDEATFRALTAINDQHIILVQLPPEALIAS